MLKFSFFYIFCLYFINLHGMNNSQIKICTNSSKNYKIICANGSYKDNKIYFNKDEIDTLSQQTFDQIIKSKNKLPFTLACVSTIKSDKEKKIKFYHLFDANSLNQNLNSSDDKEKLINPLNKLKIDNIKYYLLNPINHKFLYLGNKEQLWNKKHKVKNILLALLCSIYDACNPYAILDIGLIFEFDDNYKNLKIAEYFYDLAISLGCIEVNYLLYDISFNSNHTYEAKLYLDESLKTEASKEKLFNLALTLLTRANGKVNLNQEATKRACQILDQLKKKNYPGCNLEGIIKVLIETESNL